MTENEKYIIDIDFNEYIYIDDLYVEISLISKNKKTVLTKLFFLCESLKNKSTYTIKQIIKPRIMYILYYDVLEMLKALIEFHEESFKDVIERNEIKIIHNIEYLEDLEVNDVFDYIKPIRRDKKYEIKEITKKNY